MARLPYCMDHAWHEESNPFAGETGATGAVTTAALSASSNDFAG